MITVFFAKSKHLQPAAPPWQRKCPHHRYLSSEAAVEEEAVSGCRRYLNFFQGCDFWHASVYIAWRHDHMVWKDDQVHVCCGGGTLKNQTMQEIHWWTSISTSRRLWGDPHNTVRLNRNMRSYDRPIRKLVHSLWTARGMKMPNSMCIMISNTNSGLPQFITKVT